MAKKIDYSKYQIRAEQTDRDAIPAILRVSMQFFQDNKDTTQKCDSKAKAYARSRETLGWSTSFKWERFATEQLLPHTKLWSRGYRLVEEVRSIRLEGKGSNETVCLDCVVTNPDWKH